MGDSLRCYRNPNPRLEGNGHPWVRDWPDLEMVGDLDIPEQRLTLDSQPQRNPLPTAQDSNCEGRLGLATRIRLGHR